MPRTFDINIRLSETSFLLYGLPSWNAIMDKPVAERIALFGDPDARKRLVMEAATLIPLLLQTRIGQTYAPENACHSGRMLTEIAQEQGRMLPDVMLDIALADGLRTEFQVRGAIHADSEIVAKILDHPLIHIGGSDAGAHIAQFCGAGDTAYMLERFVREEGRMTLERAVHRMTGELARDWGISDRGTIELGKAADLVLFDPATVSRGEEIFVGDFPGGANRYVRHAAGFDKVIVNGAVVVDQGAYTAARAGTIV
jgi:N-acyl-D-aspartate/D-glutamate deacylase